jgi:hypothetical protein
MCRIVKLNDKDLNLPKLIKPRRYYIKNLLRKFIFLFKKI